MVLDRERHHPYCRACLAATVHVVGVPRYAIALDDFLAALETLQDRADEPDCPWSDDFYRLWVAWWQLQATDELPKGYRPEP